MAYGVLDKFPPPVMPLVDGRYREDLPPRLRYSELTLVTSLRQVNSFDVPCSNMF